jgi:hypothetical protein
MQLSSGPFAVETVTRTNPKATASSPSVFTAKSLQPRGLKSARAEGSLTLLTSGVLLHTQPFELGVVSIAVPLRRSSKLLLPQSAWLIVKVIAVGTIGSAWPRGAPPRCRTTSLRARGGLSSYIGGS